MKTRLFLLVGPVILIFVWFIASATGAISPIILPSPKDVGGALLQLMVTKGSLLPHSGLTLYRTVLSFLISVAVGAPIGLAMGFVPRVYRSLEFLVDFFRSIPPIALYPLFLLILGLGEQSKLGVPIYGCVLVIAVNSIYGVLNVPGVRRLVGTVYGFSDWQVFCKIVVPDSLPQVFVGMRTALSLALVLTVVVEMFFGSENGLGKKIYDYQLVFDSPKMYAAIIVTGLVGYGLNKGFMLIERKLIHWADK